MWDTLNVVEAVDTDYNSYTAESLLESCYTLLDCGLLKVLGEETFQEIDYRIETDQDTHIEKRLRVYAYGVGADMGVSALEFHTIWHGWESKYTCTRGQKMARIVVSVEADQVAI